MHEEPFYFVSTSSGPKPVDEAFFPLGGEDHAREAGFVFRSDYADVSHAPFLADMLKRPVIVISADTGSSGASMMKFDHDLTTGRSFGDKEPVILYYNRFGENGGHFRAVTKDTE